MKRSVPKPLLHFRNLGETPLSIVFDNKGDSLKTMGGKFRFLFYSVWGKGDHKLTVRSERKIELHIFNIDAAEVKK